MADISPPIEPKAPPIALKRAVPFKFSTLYLKASEIVVSCALTAKELPINKESNIFFIC